MQHSSKQHSFQLPRGTSDNGNPSNKGQLLATACWHEADFVYQSGSIYLGRNEKGQPIGINDDRHIFTAAGNRSGKGTSLIIPNLYLWEGSAVIIDPKGENAAITARHRASKDGHKVIAIDPLGESRLSDEFIGQFNPLDLIDVESDDAIDIAGVIADSMIVKANGKDMHWDESARDLVTSLILHVCDSEEADERNLGRVAQLLNKGDPEFAHILEVAQINEHEGEEDFKPQPISSFDALWSHMALSDTLNENVRDVIEGAAQCIREMGDNERGSVLSTARRNLRFLATPKIKQALSRSNFDIDALKTSKGGMSIYLCLPARMFPTHARFLRLIISMLLFRMEESGLDKAACGHATLFILDEFAALGHMEMLEKAAGLMAGYGVKLWPIVQDLSQMQKHYKESWQTFLANAGTMTFFANNDLVTLEWLSKRMGQSEIIRENMGRSVSDTQGSSKSDSENRNTGTNYSSGQSHSTSEMAALSELATIQGGQSLFDIFTRRFKPSTASSQSNSSNEGGSHQEGCSHTQSENTSKTKARSKNEQIYKTSLMTPDKIASHFNRESSVSIAFVSGKGPYAIRRTPYYQDEAFRALW